MSLFRFPNRPIYLLEKLILNFYLCTHIWKRSICGLFVALAFWEALAYIATIRPQSIVRWANWV